MSATRNPTSTGICCVLRAFVVFYGHLLGLTVIRRVLRAFVFYGHLYFTGICILRAFVFYGHLLDFTGICILRVFVGFYGHLLDFTGICILRVFVGFYGHLYFTGICWILRAFVGFYGHLLGFVPQPNLPLCKLIQLSLKINSYIRL
ncbi:hypothetical protein [Scytonema sp. NUACC26]|uniref:hypothetical protein n=1 Tax=Scytonema sp. NUACC26 TaxID=3140176 RepID=UPI0038B2C762